MRYKLIILFLFYHIVSFSQDEIYFYKDVDNTLTLKNVKEKEFVLLKDQINEGYTNATYWFKIPANQTKTKYIFRFSYDRYNEATLYQGFYQIDKLPNQRYLTYSFFRDYDVFIKIKPKLHSTFPIEFNTEEISLLNQKHQLIFNCFYYGIAFLIILYNFFYYILFKDDAFLFYSLFSGFMCFGIFTMDGMLNFYNLSEGLKDFIMVLNYILMVYFSSKFVNSYLSLDCYYPKLKKYSYIIGALIVVMGTLYLTLKNYYFLLTLSILVFSLIFTYWIASILLFNKNIYTKILVFAESLLLFSAIDFFILKFIGITVVNIDSISIKIGAFFEMIILSFGVLYRMKMLIKENDFMKNEIINYSREIEVLSVNTKDDSNSHSIGNLSIREKEIFDLIVLGKSNKIIADDLNISINTVKFHVKNIYGKLNIKSRKEVLKI
ncbi:LuxR C-terminal-related transcriptional regulator [Polaribacter undariae]|uniref:LuxR C-terminal-related transcriptional regulator n=1 Tax=Polaribacter sejongensis TaxID=985043 RepID=A0AAJ1QYB9_9FLAO|nr:LuxR C-terminal-related transcriptional regulator [Polaribacter undariae]MDN3620255.1 LuxR C-terminal-related transcriptional regulator [Polaribacter undariae]UWD32656.1 LuxR C-terminal-related transcriptional regulator [Polaribacter undariae]